MYDVVVIGGGAAGMMSAAAAATSGCSVLLLERNEKLGKKIYITGKGRCNVTNACATEDFFKYVVSNPKFLYSAAYTFDHYRVMDFFENYGVPLKTERGNRVFPVSDHASDIIKGLTCALNELHVKFMLNQRVTDIAIKDQAAQRGLKSTEAFTVKTESGGEFSASRVILATGGKSYPSTGSTGDGYTFAKKLGHTVTRLSPGLVAMYAREADIPLLQGLSLKNVQARICFGGKVLFEDFGEMLFTHFGVSGPLMLSASSIVQDTLAQHELTLEVDLKPALDEAQLDKRILRDFEENKNRQFKNALAKLLPAKLIPVIVARSGIDPEKKVHDITKAERAGLLQEIRHFHVTLTGLRDFSEAIITKGGVNVKEVNASTMESKRTPGLFFAGELLDVDALTGGFNLQVAWSTGYLAGQSAAESLGMAAAYGK